MPKYVATLRAVYDADDDVTAIFMADQIRVNGEQDLDDDDGNSLEVTQVTSMEVDLEPDEIITQLRHTRNILIKTRIKECFAEARQLDMLVHMLQHRHEPAIAMAGYDYSTFMDVAEAILIRNEVPSV
jgi:hypothetical protein